MNEEKFSNCLEQYIQHCAISSWVKDECYKFYFASWLSRKVNLKLQDDNKILSLCRESLKQDYSLKTDLSNFGVQFLQKGGREKISVPIKLADVEIIKYLMENEIPEEAFFEKRGISYTALSGWLGTLLPHKFLPVVTDDFFESITYLFDLGDFPKKGYNYFIEAQKYLGITKTHLRNHNLDSLYLTYINQYLKELYPREEKKRYQEIDWNWITQDFHLFIHRKHLGLHQPKSKPSSIPKTSKDETNNKDSTELIKLTEIAPLDIYNTVVFPDIDATELLDNRDLVFTEQDYLEKYQNQLRKGSMTEQFVFLDEVEFLNKSGKKEIAEKVKIVSSNPDFGFDILSYEIDGTEKQIEVKSISTDSPKSFFVSEHEMKKSAQLSNYYIYCVLSCESKTPIIYRLKNPDLTNKELFKLAMVSYKVSFM